MKRKDIPKATPRAFHPGGMVPPSYGPRPIPGVGTAMPGTPTANPFSIPGYGGQANPLVGGGGKPAIPVDAMPRPRMPRRPRGTGGMPRMPRRLPRGMDPTRAFRAR